MLDKVIWILCSLWTAFLIWEGWNHRCLWFHGAYHQVDNSTIVTKVSCSKCGKHWEYNPYMEV